MLVSASAPARRALTVGCALTALLCAPATASAAFGDRPLGPGQRGHDVRVLQSWLTRAGFSVAVDGEYGRRTRLAVAGWEAAQGLASDGSVSVQEAATLRRQIESGDGGASAGEAPAPTATGARARISSDGRTAVAPAGAPAAVRAAIAGANRITRKPYRYGGGHARFSDTGYDCSGAVSYALRAARLLSSPLASSGLMRFGQGGRGRWISVYAHGGHAFVVIAGLRFDTSGAGESGPRWRREARSKRGYTVRHPAGL